MAQYKYDIIVVGGGSAGLVASKLAKGMGQRVVIIENNKLGGECTWTGCVPSKTIIKSAYVAHTIKHAQQFGIAVDNSAINTRNVMDHVRNTVKEVYQTHTPDEITKLGIDLIFGDPQFVDPHTVLVNGKHVTGKKIILCTGSSPFVPPIEGIDTVPYLTNDTLFSLEKIPDSMLILGGGAIGVEMGCAFSRLGCNVTIIELADRLLPKEDAQMARMIMDEYTKEGIAIATGMKAIKAQKTGNKVEVVCKDNNNVEHVFSADTVLLGVGRTPNVKGLGLESIGVSYTRKKVVVNKYLQTDVNHIYACGDIVGPYQFSHMAFYQASRAVQNALLPFKRAVNYDNVAWVTFSSPELATAGLTEEQARARYGDSLRIYCKPYAELDRAHTESDLRGMGKFICTKQGYIVGAHILGARAGELIHEIQVAKSRGLKFEDLYSVIHAYPTYSELIWHSAKNRYIGKLEDSKVIGLLRWLYSFFQ